MGVGITKTINAELLTFRMDSGGYITYVFRNLDSKTAFDRYAMCVRFPNWDCANLEIGDKGFLSYRIVKAGEDYWYDKNTGKYEPYKQTDCHFINFVTYKNNDLKDIIL